MKKRQGSQKSRTISRKTNRAHPATATAAIRRANAAALPGTVRLARGKPLSLSQDQVLHLQRTLGNRQVSQVLGRAPVGAIQRNGTATIDIVEKSFLGELIKKTSDGDLPDQDQWDYKPQPDKGSEYYFRKKKAAKFTKRGADELAAAQRASQVDALKKNSELFGTAEGGDQEGTFEYVANYLYAEAYKTNVASALQIWDEVYDVADAPGGVVKVRKVINDGKKKELLQRMIDIGLDASWQKMSVDQLIQEKVKGQQPVAAMAQVKPTWWSDYLLDIYHWRPWSKLTGIGFHTTDGQPGTVLKGKAEGGWGGISRPITAQFFKNRYALAQGWNPLGGWLQEKGPTFRKGIKDNELLSTVSVATELHKSVKFPLANKNRAGAEHNVMKNGVKSFKMTSYAYVVVIREGFATFAKQVNPFPEIATGDIPISEIVGYAKITRWHDYKDAGGNPDSDNFWYEVEDFVPNPAGPQDQRYTKLAQAEIAKEKAISAAKYTAAG